MGGAYTAVPETDTTPTRPPGWPIWWPFPGAYPPGYEPDLSMVITAQEFLGFSESIPVTGSLRDQSTYATNEPEDSLILWTAKNSAGETVRLRVSGGGEYFNSRTTAVSLGEVYWGSDVEFEFELEIGDDGDVVTLTGTSVIVGETITQSVDIEISAVQYTLLITGTLSSNSREDIQYVRALSTVSRVIAGGSEGREVRYIGDFPADALEISTGDFGEISGSSSPTTDRAGGDVVTLTSLALDPNGWYQFSVGIEAYRGAGAALPVTMETRILVVEEVNDVVIYDSSTTESVNPGYNQTESDLHFVSVDLR